MTWYKEITRGLISDFKVFSRGLVFKYCGPSKTKMTKERMEKIAMSCQCRGGVSVLDELLIRSEKESTTLDDFLANIHIMRMVLWNEAAENSECMKKIDLETAMTAYPDITKLLTSQKKVGV